MEIYIKYIYISKKIGIYLFIINDEKKKIKIYLEFDYYCCCYLIIVKILWERYLW